MAISRVTGPGMSIPRRGRVRGECGRVPPPSLRTSYTVELAKNLREVTHCPEKAGEDP